MEKIKTKTYANTYLYGMTENYEKKLFDFIMKAEQLNKADASFDDIRYEVKKRQVTNTLVKILDSKMIVLLMRAEPLPKAFKVFAAKDIKSDGKMKVFIDCSGLINFIDGRYSCNNIDIFVAYLLSAMNQYIYYVDPNRIVMNNNIVTDGALCFSSLFTHIVDYIEKISIISATKNKCLYMTSLYYQVNILNKEINDGVKATCRKVSGLSEREEEIILIQLEENSLLNIKYFIDSLSKILKLNKITLDIFLEKWLYLYGVGTQFALELYPAFAELLTDAYVGCYINNQKTIEKICGRNMVDFTNSIFKIGVESV